MPNRLKRVTLDPETVTSGSSTRATISYQCEIDAIVEISCSNGFSVSERTVPLSASAGGSKSFDLTIKRGDGTPSDTDCLLAFNLLNTSHKRKRVKVT